MRYRGRERAWGSLGPAAVSIAIGRAYELICCKEDGLMVRLVYVLLRLPEDDFAMVVFVEIVVERGEGGPDGDAQKGLDTARIVTDVEVVKPFELWQFRFWLKVVTGGSI